MTAKDDLDRRKIMDWVRPDSVAYGNVIAMLATTFDLDPTFFDSDYLPTFLGLGAWEDTSWSNRVAMQRALANTEATAVMMDARRFRGRPRSLHIEVMPAIGSGGMKLHAKVLVVVQERAVRLLVGSANLTDNSYRHNREVVLPIIATAQTPELSSLVEQALIAMPTVLRPWWTEYADRVHFLALQTMADWHKSAPANDRFVWSWGEQSLSTQFTSLWPDEKIKAVTVISPFWSDEGDNGPLDQLLRQLGYNRLAGANVRLLTEAAPETQTTFRPTIPAALAAWDTRRLGIQAQVEAVDPHVLPEEVGGRTDFQPVRPLHAKIVMVEGAQTTLAYIGSANFTLHGWGFVGPKSNIEAGVILLRQGKNRRSLVSLLPKTTGKPVPLDGSGRGSVTVLQKSDEDTAWPTFIRDIRLVPTGIDNKQLQLLATLTTAKAPAAFSASLVADDDVVLLDAVHLASGVLKRDIFEQVLRDQRVNVRWETQRVEFPVNVDLEARLLLPLSPKSEPPGENALLAYYQGKITAEDIYPAPPGEPDTTRDPLTNIADESIVDTARIQSYQIREFVEALRGIHDDLQSAAKGTEPAMKHALLGEVSPIALAREVIKAVHECRRSPTAAGFQLVEILVCLAKAEHFYTSPKRKDAWRECVARARKDITTLLSDLIEWNGGELRSQRAFHRYRTAILPQLAKP
jgi:hypothetical protein